MREGPLPTPPPPDVSTIPIPPPMPPSTGPPPPPPPIVGSTTRFSASEQVSTKVIGPCPPPPPPLPPDGGKSKTLPNNEKSSSSNTGLSHNKTASLPSSTSLTRPPPPPPLPPLTGLNPGFVEDIYDTSMSYPETDLHQKTKELENLLADMENITEQLDADDDPVDEYVEVNPERVHGKSNSSAPDYVNFDQKRRVSFDVPEIQPQDDYVEMTSSMRRDQRAVKFTSTEDMYI